MNPFESIKLLYTHRVYRAASTAALVGGISCYLLLVYKPNLLGDVQSYLAKPKQEDKKQ